MKEANQYVEDKEKNEWDNSLREWGLRFRKEHEEKYGNKTENHNHIEKPKNFFVSSTFERIRDTVYSCRALNGVGLITGEPGIGKSIALQWLAADEPYHAVYVQANNAERNLKPFLRKICHAFGWNTDAQYNRDLWDIIESRMPDAAERGCYIMVDEAQTLMDTVLRELVDFPSYFKVPIILVGNESTLQRKNVEAAFKQVLDRISYRVKLKKPEDKDYGNIGVSYDVYGKDARQYLVLYGRNTSLRRVDQLLKYARAIAGQDGPVRLQHLQSANYQLNGEEGADLLIINQ